MTTLPSVFRNKVFVVLGLFIIIVLGALGYLFFQNQEQPLGKPQVPAPKLEASQVNPNGTQGSVTVWAWNTAADALQLVVPAFNKVYPNIKVNIVKIPYNEANDRFRVAIANKTGFPDVWDTEGPVTLGYIQSGSLTDITDIANKYLKDFVPYKWTEVMKDNHIYALPWDSAPVGLFYRRDLFEKAGIDPNTLTTWDAYIAAGQKFMKVMNPAGKPTQYMTLMSTQSDVGDWWQMFISQYGGTIFNDKGNPVLNSSESVQSVTLMKKILDSGIAANIGWWTPEFFDAIKSGKIASFAQGVWMGGQIKQTAPNLSGKWGVVPIPAVTDGGVRSAVRGGSNLAIPSLSTNKDAAWKFIEFALANKTSQLTMYKQFDIFPALLTAYDDPVFNEPNTYFGNENTSRLFIEAQKNIPLTFHYGANDSEIINLGGTEIVQALSGTKAIQQALNDAQLKAVNLFKSQ